MNKRRLVVVLLGIFMIAVLIFQFLMHPYSIIEDISVTMLSIIPSLISFYLFSAFNKEKDYEEANQIYENIRGSVRLSRANIQKGEKVQNDVEETSDILELMLANMREIKDYMY